MCNSLNVFLFYSGKFVTQAELHLPRKRNCGSLLATPRLVICLHYKTLSIWFREAAVLSSAGHCIFWIEA